MPMKYCSVLKGEKKVDVFLFHGYNSSTSAQQSIAERLNSRGYNVLSCGYIGHDGRKGNKKDVYKSLVEIENIIKNMKNPVIVIGHSMGGAMALSVAARNDNVVQAFAVAAPNGAKFSEKAHMRKISLIFMQRFTDSDKKKMRKAMPATNGYCDDSRPGKYFLVHSRSDSIVPFSEFEANKALFCVPKRNTLVYDKITGLGLPDHVQTMYAPETIAFIEKKMVR